MNNSAPERVRGMAGHGANPETRDLAIPPAPGAHHGISRGPPLSSRANAHELVVVDVASSATLAYLAILWRQRELLLTAKLKSFACFY